MKILMATMGLDIGGAETHIVELAKELKNEGHDVAIVSNGGVYVSEITAAGIRHYEAPLHRRSLRDMASARRILRQVIVGEAPDVVHAHARIPAFLCGGFCKKRGIPFVTTAHWVFDTSGVLRYLTNWGERTVAVSEDIKAYLIREYNTPAEHITVTINGIDTEKFSPRLTGAGVMSEFGLDPDRPVLSYVSRMDEDRALVARQLIAIAPELDRAVPGIQLLIAGGGNVLDELKAQAAQVNARLGRPCVTMTGPRTDINEIAAAGQLFVGVSRSALEAMAAGKPVIVAGNEGYHGLFGPDKLAVARAGNFCCRGMPVSRPERLLADVTAAFRLPPEEKERLGAYGRQVIFDHYSVHRMAADCLSVYEQVRRKKYRVVMSGYYGFGNAGDDAILESIQQAIRAASDDVSVTVLSNDPEQTHRQYGLEAIPRFRIWKVFQALRRGDALLSGGGSLLQDTTSTRSLLYYLSVIRCARLLGKPVMLYANGIGPVKKPANRRRVKKVVEGAALVTLRDHASAKELEAMGVTRPVQVTADPVFHLEPAGTERARELLSAAGIPQGPFVAVSVRDWQDVGNFYTQLARLCDHLRRKHALEVLFLLMQPDRDRSATARVQGLMEEPAHVLDVPCTPRELMGVLGQAKLCLAMRLHTLIFAARMAVPAMGLVYDPKVASYLEELDLPAAGDVERFDGPEAVRRADRLMADYDNVLARLREKSTRLSQAARKNERLRLELLERTRE